MNKYDYKITVYENNLIKHNGHNIRNIGYTDKDNYDDYKKNAGRNMRNKHGSL